MSKARALVLLLLVLCSLSAVAAVHEERPRLELRARADAEFVLLRMELTPLPGGKYVVHGEVRLLAGERLRLEYDVDVRQRTYTTRVREHHLPERITTNDYTLCVMQYANVASYDPVGIEVAHTTNLLRWTADTYAGTVEAYRGSGSCWANTYTSVGTSWAVTGCYRPPASGLGYTLYKDVSGSYINYDVGSSSLATNAYQWTEIEAYGTAALVSWDAVHDGEASYLLHGSLNSGSSSYDGECGFQREPIDKPWENCPLLLDLNGDGLHTSTDAVEFDLDADGIRERITWSDASSEEGFLWIDLDENHRVDDGAELFGTGTLLPNGARAANGFEALEVYDDPAHGGDGNGVLSAGDQMWGRLRLWIDRNHDGISSHDETATLAQMGVSALELTYDTGVSPDEADNDHRFRGKYIKRLSSNRTLPLLMDDVFFQRLP